MKLAIQRLDALTRAAQKAKNPEFKELWIIKRKELVRKLQSGNSHDELSGELLC